MGEDLDSLSVKELHNLEEQMDTALKHVRSRKVGLFVLSDVFVWICFFFFFFFLIIIFNY